MLQFSSLVSRVMEAANHSKNSAVEAENHVKHGAISKSYTSRRYFLGAACSLLLALCLSLFTACGDDDDGNASNIVGLWTFVNLTLDAVNPQNPELAEDEMEWIPLASVFLQGTTIEFKSNGTFVFTIMGEKENGTYTYDGSRFTMTIDGETLDSDSSISSGDYVTLSNGVLTLVSANLDNCYDWEYDEDDEEICLETYRQAGFTKHETKMTFKK